ncbi:tetratricopeptide repeat domain protein [Desulfosarcina variabilis str. Montpellier]
MLPVEKTGIFEEKDSDDLFDALTLQQSKLESLSNQFLQTGIDQYMKKDYTAAAKSFQAALSIAPSSSYSSDTTQYLVQTYLKLEETDKAIETYAQAIERTPSDEQLQSALAQLLYSEDRYEEASEHYRAAMEINPSAENRYTYGESLLKIENYSEAEYQFNQVKRLEPESYAGDYGLGKMYAQTENYEKAIEHFKSAIELDPTFFDAQAEIGYAYADMGEIDEARKVQEQLQENDEDLALTLQYYIDEKEPPQIAFAFATSSFPYSAPKGYQVSAIDSYLENAGAEKSVTMQFLFTKPMDRGSVEDPFNWSISRQSSNNLAETYNFGDTIPETEIWLDPYPDYVLYDDDSQTATVGFTIRQNDTADGTIDPSHIMFKFNGEDLYGVSMDPDADEFSGFSKTV